jgi:hypothetical protein
MAFAAKRSPAHLASGQRDRRLAILRGRGRELSKAQVSLEVSLVAPSRDPTLATHERCHALWMALRPNRVSWGLRT